MKTFSIDTLGCKVNQYESQQIRELLEQLGLTQVQTCQKPDLAVVNTCCVTVSASAKSRQYLRRAQKLSPDAAVIACGCLPGIKTDELRNPGEKTHLITDRSNLAADISKIVNGKSFACPALPRLTSFKGHTRAFLKIQDGCDGHCSYCIIPKTRPHVQSRTPRAVLQEAQRLVEAGHKEIVLTGIFLGAFGQSSVRRKNWPCRENTRLAELLDKMARIPKLKRIRLSSLEPGDITARLLDVLGNHRNIMPHLHLSLQSGSDAILKRMCRPYRAADFRDKVELIKARLDRPAITTDIIVGFPGETDADFEATVELAKNVGFAKMHIFTFSPRKGTPAADLKDTVDDRVIKRRSQILRHLDVELAYKFRQQFIGGTKTVLVENGNGRLCGRSERYFMVRLQGPACRRNELVAVKLVENTENTAIGQLATTQQPMNSE